MNLINFHTDYIATKAINLFNDKVQITLDSIEWVSLLDCSEYRTFTIGSLSLDNYPYNYQFALMLVGFKLRLKYNKKEAVNDTE